MRLHPALLVVVLLAGEGLAAASSIVVNGSFESSDGTLSGGEAPSGSTAITGWVVTGTSPSNAVVDWIGPGGGGPTWLVSDGSHAIDLDGRDSVNSSISQTLSTVIGQIYVLSFDLSGNPGDSRNVGYPLIKGVRVSVGGRSRDLQFDVTGLTTDSLVWQTITFSFLATQTNSVLSFTSLTGTPNSYGALIDNVSVQSSAPVPEPATLFSAALGLMVIALRRHLARLFVRDSSRP